MTIAHPLLFLRHGETAWNAAGRYQGTQDVALSDAGRAQMQRQRARVDALMADGTVDAQRLAITTSPLLRARESAEALGFDRSLHIEHRLREIAMGRWEGMTSMEVKAQFYEERKSRKRDRWHFAPLGGESMHARAEDVRAALADLPPHTLVVTHAVILRIIHHLLGSVERETAAALTIPHEGVLLFDGTALREMVQTQ